ncbi:acyl-phosphate glycerol 3-phosphate acyltransferase [Nonlabens sp. YIK11]|uniref:lysophospholipid acyltransferase family protein n=1 Tax=Nonlabens sp. YIK11 TaxID=1453349 RepID=UPI0006DC3D12|nr:lysophospholipid acyltransferase family protein [Nonlabens sp. YIK11]KQC32297.1 acyl-phosphate glycerol 3-phosphate acyltransferase [Nonlabens sp. YIK11]
MKWIRYIVMPIYRVWFYVLLAIPILVMFPFLVLATISEKTYGIFFKMAQAWAAFVIYGMFWWPQIYRDAHMQKGQSYMLVANHTSMADIMLMLLVAKNPFVFVGKAELSKIPIFGFFYKRTCILVDRGDPQSRKAVFESASRRLDDGVGICIFPEGGVPSDRSILLDNFKDGAFRLAIEHQIPVVPMSFYDNKKRFPFSFFHGSPGRMRARTHEIQQTAGLQLPGDKVRFRESVRNIIYEDLVRQQNS